MSLFDRMKLWRRDEQQNRSDAVEERAEEVLDEPAGDPTHVESPDDFPQPTV